MIATENFHNSKESNFANKFQFSEKESIKIEMDLLASFLKIKVPKGKNYGIQTLSCCDFDYKIIKTGFETTQKVNFNPNLIQ